MNQIQKVVCIECKKTKEIMSDNDLLTFVCSPCTVKCSYKDKEIKQIDGAPRGYVKNSPFRVKQ